MKYAIFGLSICLLITILLLVVIIIVNKNKRYNQKEQSYDLNMAGLKIKEDLKNSLDESNRNINQSILSFERQINERLENKMIQINEALAKRIGELNMNVGSSINMSMKATSEAYTKLSERITKIDEAQKGMSLIGQEVLSLKNILENNQQRGKFGEYSLEQLVYSVFGDTKGSVYDFQYSLRIDDFNERPDCAIFLPEPYKMVLIDSKFPFAGYNSIIESNDETNIKEFRAAIKKHIADVSKKYIIPERTAPYAILYIPSDAIYGYINSYLYDMVEYARGMYVIMSSPSTLLPILANINMVKIDYNRSQNLKAIREEISTIVKEFRLFNDDWQKYSKAVASVINSTSDLEHRVSLMNKRLNGIDTKME